MIPTPSALPAIAGSQGRLKPRVASLAVRLTTGLAVALLALGGCVLPACGAVLDDEAAARSIQARYEQALPDLPPGKQRHYAQRLYRMTGDARYLPLNRAYGRRLVSTLREEIDGLADSDHAARRAREALAAYPIGSEKQRRRRRMLAEWGEIAYAKGLAFKLTQAKYHGLLNDVALPGHRRALDYMASVDFRPFLLDPDVMAVYAAQVANLAYYLDELGVVDLREVVASAFRRQYPPARDARLSTAEYRNKIYGMTHFVIAASDYYQRPVDAEAFRWVLRVRRRTAAPPPGHQGGHRCGGGHQFLAGR